MLETNFNPFPELNTERLRLRKLDLKDAKDIFEIRSNPQVMKYMSRPLTKTLDDASAHIEKVLKNMADNNGIDWGIEEKKSGKLIGTIAFWRIMKERYRAEIGYCLNEKWHKTGVMNEAFSVVIPYGFQQLNLHSIEANIDPINVASAALLEKNKFRKEAYFKENFFFDGMFLDSAIYSLVKSIDFN